MSPLKKQLFDLQVKGQGPMKVITLCDTPPYGHAPTYQISLTYLDKLRWKEAEEEAEEEKIRLKQYVSLRSKGRHNYLSCIKGPWPVINYCPWTMDVFNSHLDQRIIY